MSLRVCREERPGLQLDSLVTIHVVELSEREAEDTGELREQKQGNKYAVLVATSSKDPKIQKWGICDFLLQRGKGLSEMNLYHSHLN